MITCTSPVSRVLFSLPMGNSIESEIIDLRCCNSIQLIANWTGESDPSGVLRVYYSAYRNMIRSVHRVSNDISVTGSPLFATIEPTVKSAFYKVVYLRTGGGDGDTLTVDLVAKYF